MSIIFRRSTNRAFSPPSSSKTPQKPAWFSGASTKDLRKTIVRTVRHIPSPKING
ncbi:MAG: hypothetical protein ACFFHD_03135 [Promethearchaeota archaeon]